MENMISVLDCTLRDGGYINDWNWGHSKVKDIIKSLVLAKVDVVEVGFLRNIDVFDKNITVCNTIEELNSFLPEKCGNTMFSGMAMRSNYDIKKLSPYSGKGIEIIRITAHDYDLDEGLSFAQQVKDKGYKVSINPINIMGYTDEKILYIIDKVNAIKPYQFAIVDTFGSMKRRDLDRIVSIVDNNLDKSVRLALHLHENMSLSFSLAQNFIDKRLNRPISIDGSLMGMGRIPGNLPIELITDYLNDYLNKTYDIDYMMDAIQDYISPLKGGNNWGYTPAYFLSARYNLHRNYAEHYLKKGDLTHRDINYILSNILPNKKTVFDIQYADRLYEEYKNLEYDDTNDKQSLFALLNGKNIVLIAPGASINQTKEVIDEYVSDDNNIIIGVNFVPVNYRVDYCFFSNRKCFIKVDNPACKIIITSNLIGDKCDYKISYSSLSDNNFLEYNSLVMILRLLKSLCVNKVMIAGADGYRNNNNYFDDIYASGVEKSIEYNKKIAKAIKDLELNIEYITPSLYEN